MRKNNGPRIEPWGTPAVVLVQEKIRLYEKSCKISCRFGRYTIFFQLKHDTVVPNLVKNFRDIKKNISNVIAAIKRFVSFMIY